MVKKTIQIIMSKKHKIVKPKNVFYFHFLINSFLVVKNPGNKYIINRTKDTKNDNKNNTVGIKGPIKDTIEEFS